MPGCSSKRLDRSYVGSESRRHSWQRGQGRGWWGGLRLIPPAASHGQDAPSFSSLAAHSWAVLL
eukprot:2523852-Prorocentrum_lima.AAC.1